MLLTTSIQKLIAGSSLEEYIPSIYKKVDQKAIASLFNTAKPSEIIITRELLKQLLYKTLQKNKGVKDIIKINILKLLRIIAKIIKKSINTLNIKQI